MRQTKAQLATLLHNAERKIEEQRAQLAALTVPPAAQSMGEITHALEDGDECPACNGSGVHTSGGDCFRCKGKGWQNAEDVMRNATYDRVRAKRREVGGKEGYASLRAIPTELKLGKTVTRIDGLFYVND